MYRRFLYFAHALAFPGRISLERARVLSVLVLLVAAARPGDSTTPDKFVNWENPPTHPMVLSPNGLWLALCNLPDARVEIFNVSTGIPVYAGTVSVGLDPVSVRFLNDNELWVVNHISDTVSIVDMIKLRVVATLQTLDEPCDVVFAGNPLRAFVSCSQVNKIQVFNPATRTATGQVVEIDGEDPRSLAVSADGTKVFAAIFESGNGSTLIGGGAQDFNVISFPPNDALNDLAGPYGGANPPPNNGAFYSPPKNPALPTPPRVGLIVKKNAAGRWRDDNIGDWTDYITGPKAHMSGRPMGWDLPDHDLAIIDANTHAVSYVSRLMNICMSLSIHPATGFITMIGTEAENQVRFEPQVKGRFLRVNMAIVNPANGQTTIVDLNPHLNYALSTIAQSERDKSLGDPRGIVWNSAGTAGYITGMGSNNLIIVDGAGNRLTAIPIELGDGPTGLVLDEARAKLYIFNRFEGSISVIDTNSNIEILRQPIFDPTPQVIRVGRKHLYDTHKNSGLGQIACASCHIDSRMDRLAWDLGDPSGTMKSVSQMTHNLGNNIPGLNTGFADFHPMKGPMTTQTLQDIIGHEPLHWRGDRDGLEEFNQAFPGLQGDDTLLTPPEMQEYEDFLHTVVFPPNVFRNFDNTLSPNVDLTGHFSIGRFAGSGGLAAGGQLPNGNAVDGLNLYRSSARNIDRGSLSCVVCHTLPTGMGSDMLLSNPSTLTFVNYPTGANGEKHHSLVSVDGSTNRAIKVPQLRNQFDKVGCDFTKTSNRAGFGMLHDGSVDSIARFVSEEAFEVANDQEVADLVALVLSFAGSDLPTNSIPPGPAGGDTHAGVGRQVTITSSAPVALFGQADVINSMINVVEASSRVELIVKGAVEGRNRGWFYDKASDMFITDGGANTKISPANLRATATPTNPLTYTLVAPGTGRRLGIDRDEDGFGDYYEIAKGSDPANGQSLPPANEAHNWSLYY